MGVALVLKAYHFMAYESLHEDQQQVLKSRAVRNRQGPLGVGYEFTGLGR